MNRQKIVKIGPEVFITKYIVIGIVVLAILCAGTPDILDRIGDFIQNGSNFIKHDLKEVMMTKGEMP